MAEIKTYVIPSRLYRYRSGKSLERDLDALINGELWCSRFDQQNDPMEGLYSARRSIQKDPNYRSRLKNISHGKRTIGMCSFTEVKDHELMWAHYADQFRGYCISYVTKSLLAKLPEEVDLIRLYYSDYPPKINQEHERPEKVILSYKHNKWLYEREWRLLAPRLGSLGYQETSCVSKIYLGPRMLEDTRSFIADRLKNSGIEIREMIVNGYKVEEVSGETSSSI